MTRPIAIPLAAALAALGFSVGALAAGNLPKAHVKFLQEAAADNMAEIDLGKLAQEKAMREEVKGFAGRMVEDHTKALEELKAVANANSVTLPAGPDKKHEKLRAKLEKLQGGDFDREYMKHMVSDHKHDVHEFKETAHSRKESDVKTFAAKTLPTLQSHLDSARATNDIAQAAKRAGKRETGSTKS